MNKSIVCYFSATKVTKEVAEKISLALNCKLFEIKPLEEYTNKDLDWQDSSSRTSNEMKDENCRVAIKENLVNIDDYDTIIIGYPIWWDLAPKIINTFIESVDLTKKRIYLFATSGGSSIKNSANNLKKEYPKLNIVDSKLLSKYTKDAEIKSWLK